MKRSPIRVLLADDHPVIHQGIAGALFAETQVLLIGAARDYQDLTEQLTRLPIDVVVLDLNGMGVGPIQMVRELRQDFSDVRLLVFSALLDLAPEILAAGALGYVVKEELLSHLPTAIRNIAAGQRYLSPLVQSYLERASYMERAVPLAPQELVILKLLAHGKTTPQIVSLLEIHRRTVQNYITSLFRKTGCDDRTQLVAWYRRRFESDPW